MKVRALNYKLILVFVLPIVGFTAQGQVGGVIPVRKSVTADFVALQPVAAKMNMAFYRNQLITTTRPHVGFSLSTKSLPAKDHYTSNFGFFCKKELQLEKITKIPLRVRVGSLEQCNWLEQKN